MKQLVILASLFISVVFVSCKKTYTCSCKSSTTVEVESRTLKVKDYDEGLKECAAVEKEYLERHVAANVSCGLK
jgi:hypothetical protein